MWKNRYNVVHVIQTRFMQFQPNLLELGRARLRLFQAVTLPSVTQQSNQDYLWIIRTDPQLAPELRDELIASVAAFENIILVGSNDNPEGFKTLDCIADMLQQQERDDPIWSGSFATVQSYHDVAQNHIVLETRLDADDIVQLTNKRVLECWFQWRGEAFKVWLREIMI